MRNPENGYGLLSRALHGIMFILILGMLGVGLYMTDLDKTDELRKQLFSIHMSTGVLILILVLAVVRVAWLRISPAPGVPSGLLNSEKILTAVVKSAMYLLRLAIPLVGILVVNTKGYPVSFYGLFDLFRLAGENEELQEFMEEAHEFLAFSLLFLVVLHVAGALKHRFLDTGRTSM